MLNNLEFLLDVDGVLTTGNFFYTIDGKIMKEFGPHDAYSLSNIKNKLRIQFISADKRGFDISKKRISDMGFDLTYVPEEERYNFVKQNFDFTKLIFMGDGDADAKVLKDSFIGIAPKNSRPSALEAADYVTELAGGKGAVAEACDYLEQKLFNKNI